MGVRYHAKERLVAAGVSQWFYEEREIPLYPTSMLLVRVIIAKILDRDLLKDILRATPIRQGEEGWNCVGWVREGLERLEEDGDALGTSVTDWGTVRDAAMNYVQWKKDQHRFDGRADWDTSRPPTYDLITGREVIP